MNDNTGIKLNVLMLLVAVMLIALGIQSVVIYRLTGRERSSSELVDQDRTDVKSGDLDHEMPVTKGYGRDDSFFKDPLFNMNSDDWDPFKEMHSMHERINRMFGNAFGRFEQSDHFNDLFQDYTFSPNMNMEEKEDRYIVTMDAPGTDESRIEIDLEGKMLTVRGEMDKSAETKDGNSWIMRERHSGSFRRSFSLPGPVKADEMTYSTENGVLRIEIPKDNMDNRSDASEAGESASK
ncbi:MAG: Hsp20/alpha crystallin family protein [Kiritimatiellia bacterium]